jgi:hypothetical protein
MISTVCREEQGDEVIHIRNRNCGLFANLNACVGILAYADEKNLPCEVHWTENWESTDFPYGAGGVNVWSQLFESLDSSKASSGNVTVLYEAPAHWDHRAMHDRGQRLRLHRVYTRHIRPRQHILDRVNAFYSKYLSGSPFVGLHIRHHHHVVEQYGQTMPTQQDYMQLVESHLGKGKVFIASDVQEICDVLMTHYGEDVVFQSDVTRSSQSQTQVHRNSSTPGIKLAEDVLTDCLLLAKAPLVYGVYSNVTAAACYINPDLEFVLVPRAQSVDDSSAMTGADLSTGLWLVPAIDQDACRIIEYSLANTIPAVRAQAAGLARFGAVHAWGWCRDDQADFKRIQAGDACLFYAKNPGEPDSSFKWYSTVLAKVESETISRTLWDTQNRPLICFLSEPLRVAAGWSELCDAIEPYLGGKTLRPLRQLTRIGSTVVNGISEHFGSLEMWIRRTRRIA